MSENSIVEITPTHTATTMTPSGPVTTNSDQTPQERFDTLLIAHGGEKAAPVWKGPGPPPGVHWDSTSRQMVIDPTPQERAQQEARAAADRAKGEKILQAAKAKAEERPDSSRQDVGMRGTEKVHQQTLDVLNTNFRQQMTLVQKLPSLEREAREAALRLQYNNELAQVLDGRVANVFKTPAAPTPGKPITGTPAAHEYSVALKAALSVVETHGAIPAHAIPAALTSGYTLPDGSYDGIQDLAEGLVLARQAGWSQDKVTTFIKRTLR